MTGAARTTENRTLRRLPNASYRQREYLTEAEVERLIDAARKRGRNGPRDAAAILLAYRHGLRAAELCQLRWAQVDLRHGRLHVNRTKGGCASVHPLHGPELRALRPLHGSGPYVFVTEAGTPTTTACSCEWCSEPAKRRSYHSRCIRTCYGIRRAISLPMMGTTRGRLRTTLDIGICNRLRGTPRWPKAGSRGSGGIRKGLVWPLCNRSGQTLRW